MSSDNGHRRRLEQRIAEIPSKYRDCRDNRYHWYGGRKKIRVYNFQDNGTPYVIRVKQCQYCTLRILEFWTRQGEFVLRRAEYPDGYIIKDYEEGEERVSARTIAATEVRRAVRAGLKEFPG